MRVACGLSICAVLVLGGCSHFYPVPVSEPCAPTDTQNPLAPCKQITNSEKPRRPNPATTFDGAKQILKLYATHYEDQADSLRRNDYQMSDVTLGGGIVGILGGLAKSSGTALAGGLIAAGGAIPESRYKLTVQAENYEKASDTMYCMHKAITAFGKVQEADKDSWLPEEVNDHIDRVRRQLRKVQSTITLTSPDLTALQKNLEELSSAQKETIRLNEQIANLKKRNQNFVASETELNEAKRIEMRSQLDKCVTSLGA